MPKKNALVVLIDALRFDIIADETMRKSLAPNIDRLVNSGGLVKIVGLASNTQFVMPSVLSGTRPLDFGGYNTGCKHRPVCFTELLQSAGYETGLFTNCALYNRDVGFDRGFNRPVVAANSRLALMQDLEYRILPPVCRWARGEVGDSEIIRYLQADYAAILENLVRVCSDEKRAPGGIPRSGRINASLAKAAAIELRLLVEDPVSIARKLALLPEAYAYAALGRKRPGPHFYFVKAVNKLYQLSTGILQRIPGLRHIRFGHFDSLMPLYDELRPSIDKFITTRKQPWFAFIHAMDVHTYSVCIDQIFRCPRLLARRLFRIPQIRRFCRQHGYRYILQYLSNLTALDDEIGKLVELLENTGQRDQTVIMVASDHGTTHSVADGHPIADLPRRFFRSDLELPVIMSEIGNNDGLTGLWDSRDISGTILDLLNVDFPSEYEGRSVLSASTRHIVVSENAGRGFCDLENDDLNFAVTAAQDKLLAVLQMDTLVATDYYNLEEDPRECKNLAGQKSAEARIDALLSALWDERGDLLTARGARPVNPANAKRGPVEAAL